MAAFILFMVFHHNGAASMQTQEFSSDAACSAALTRVLVIKEQKDLYLLSSAWCQPK